MNFELTLCIYTYLYFHLVLTGSVWFHLVFDGSDRFQLVPLVAVFVLFSPVSTTGY